MDLDTKHLDVSAPRDKLLEDLRLVVADAEDLLRTTANQAGEGATAARARIQKSLQSAKERLNDAEAAVVDRTKQAVKSTDEYVHEHPWQAMGISACVGAIIGMLIARR